MPVYRPRHIEYTIVSGHIQIVLDDGTAMPAYWAHPDHNGRFPSIALLHDWWGITEVERRLSHLFAQIGFYVIVPDLFDGRVARNPQEAYALVESIRDSAYPRVDAALHALEHHLRSNGNVGAVGLGMGGTLAFEAALTREDLEAAVAWYGFPQKYFGRFRDARAPIMAIYGEQENFVPQEAIRRLKRELAQSPLAHEVVIYPNTAREFFFTELVADSQDAGAQAWNRMLNFLDHFLMVRRESTDDRPPTPQP
jgi:carboxymethylenebutenolidase